MVTISALEFSCSNIVIICSEFTIYAHKNGNENSDYRCRCVLIAIYS